MLRRLLIPSLRFTEQVGGLEDTWLIDFGCFSHMTDDYRWFSSLTPVVSSEHITFGDHDRDKVLSEGAIKISGTSLSSALLLLSLLDSVCSRFHNCLMMVLRFASSLVPLGFWTLEVILCV